MRGAPYQEFWIRTLVGELKGIPSPLSASWNDLGNQRHQGKSAEYGCLVICIDRNPIGTFLSMHQENSEQQILDITTYVSGPMTQDIRVPRISSADPLGDRSVNHWWLYKSALGTKFRISRSWVSLPAPEERLTGKRSEMKDRTTVTRHGSHEREPLSIQPVYCEVLSTSFLQPLFKNFLMDMIFSLIWFPVRQ